MSEGRTPAEEKAWEAKGKFAALQRHLISYKAHHERLIEKILTIAEDNDIDENTAAGLRNLIHDMRSMVDNQYPSLYGLIGRARTGEQLCAGLIVDLEKPTPPEEE